jgi:hypothetical protein
LALERGDFPTAIEVLTPLAKESERIGGIAARSIAARTYNGSSRRFRLGRTSSGITCHLHC